MMMKIILGITLIVIAMPILFKVFLWFRKILMLIKFHFMTDEQWEDFIENEYENFERNTRKYSEEFIFYLKDNCENLKKYWLEELNQDDYESIEYYQELLDIQKERIEFWNNAVTSIETEIWHRQFRNSKP